ncbi:MAG: hypothetical protein OEZ43_14770 [Gammaproteobacteria bacterium]|nr:hypothetical protein [Gammaproteobacteria bacterium]
MNNRNIKLGLFFTNTNRDYNKSAASTWIRIWQMIDPYKALGVEVSFNNFFKKYDVAIVYRKSKPKYYYILKYLKLISKTVYFDTCINLFEKSWEISDERLEYAHKIAKTADGIICASSQIARFSAPYANSVYTMEDPINLDHFSTLKGDINFDKPLFGWSGVAQKSVFLNRYASEIDKRIHLITDNTITDEQLEFEYIYTQWRYETFPKELIKCDIALLPRDLNSSYNLGHSAFKALVFAVLGIPIIADKIPSYIDLTQYYDGIVFLDDYDNSIEKCIEALRLRSLDTTKVRKHYSLENQAKMQVEYFLQRLNH